MGKKLYVGNLSFTVDSDQLAGVFAEFGTVETANVITDRETGRSKGFAFVEMAAESEAQTAIQKLNGMDLGGRAMNVSEAKPQEKRSGGGGGGGRGGFGGGGRGRY
ncbi:RNA recognition motif domain-containing protein [Bdellovibrio sp. HCB337]|uniref:RNA recognition motif domain-containing protein n=1 Tax=Bdellovibrio sp. HCB337 TaxID=3394358 RepID=UPI0039A54E9B